MSGGMSSLFSVPGWYIARPSPNCKCHKVWNDVIVSSKVKEEMRRKQQWNYHTGSYYHISISWETPRCRYVRWLSLHFKILPTSLVTIECASFLLDGGCIYNSMLCLPLQECRVYDYPQCEYQLVVYTTAAWAWCLGQVSMSVQSVQNVIHMCQLQVIFHQLTTYTHVVS